MVAGAMFALLFVLSIADGIAKANGPVVEGYSAVPVPHGAAG